MSISYVRPIRNLFLLLSLAALTGCVGSATGQIIPSELTASENSFYVAHQPEDSRNLHNDIASALQSRGISATAGPADGKPSTADYVVTYIDRWQWDMRMYLSDLRIEVRDALDNSLMGFGQSAQSSFKAMGKTHEDVITAALDQLLGTGSANAE